MEKHNSDNCSSEQIREYLMTLEDAKYRDFHSSLMPTVDKIRIIGIRTPVLRAFSKKLQKQNCEAFLDDLPHRYYEENNLHGMLIEKINDFDTCVEALDVFLPYVDNWATCDLINPKIFAKNREKLISHIDSWLSCDHTYTVRFGLKMLMTYYLGEDFKKEYAERAAAIRSDEYYVRMMIAWYFATALSKNWDETVPFITEHTLDRWTHNKAIQKAKESLRITKEQKQYLKTLKY